MEPMPIMHMPRSEALRLLTEHMKYREKTEYIALEDALDRVAACDIVSKRNVPDTKCSRWDGISFSWEHYIACQRNVECWKEPEDYIMSNTGIPILQETFDTMVMIEDTVFENGQLRAIIQPNVEKNQNVNQIGHLIRLGEVLVKKGTKIIPSHLNLLAAGGLSQVPVLKKPVVAILPTGNELVSRLEEVKLGFTIESNSVSMMAKIRVWGGEPKLFPITRDGIDSISERLREAAACADLIVISGGSGRGKYDLLRVVAGTAGELLFASVDHGPGKNTSMSVIEGTPVIGLVGPPGGEEMTFDFYVRPTILACLGQRYVVTTMPAVLETDIPPHDRADFYYTLKIRRDPETLVCYARMLEHRDIDRNIAEHNGYLFVKKNEGGHQKGETVMVELRTGFENI